MGSVEQLVQHYGYPMVLLGTLFEGQPVMLFGGFAAHRGYLELVPWVILAGAVGNFVSFEAWFLAGRRFGRPLIERRPQWASRIATAQGWLSRFEGALIVGIRFLPGFDTVGTIAIGMSEVSVERFTLLNALGRAPLGREPGARGLPPRQPARGAPGRPRHDREAAPDRHPPAHARLDRLAPHPGPPRAGRDRRAPGPARLRPARPRPAAPGARQPERCSRVAPGERAGGEV